MTNKNLNSYKQALEEEEFTEEMKMICYFYGLINSFSLRLTNAFVFLTGQLISFVVL